ncbi:hypothetical protein ACFOKF_16485 [Sphingobium rhizovicinum]|uniref:NusG-like N-terminal domain-containing protein n=1 Tax=Sphingobium rhizovicinum TaxID=432308 RepID=A0ABV7NH16_9SPHN
MRTNGQKTLPLLDMLTSEGFEAWTPRRIVRRPAPGQGRRLVMGQTRRKIEVPVPILSGFVFVREGSEDDLARFACSPRTSHLPFRVMQRCGHAALVSERSVAGLREAQSIADAETQAERDAETREEAVRARAERLGTERARRKALRQVRKSFAPGDRVTVSDVSALAGLEGSITESHGTSAVIDFGGIHTMTVEAWRILPVVLRIDQP